MKNKLTGFGISLLVIAAVSISAFIPQEKNNKNEKQQQGRDKKDQDNKGNQGNQDKKGNQGNQDNKGNQGNKDNKGNQGNQGNNGNDKKGNANNGNNANDGSNGNQGKKDGKNKNDRGEYDGDWNNNYGYNWTRETFKDRRKFKNQEKVIICHKFNRSNGSGVSINVSANALKAHMNHGDVMGDCPVNRDDRYSDIFIRKRNVYYNYIQETEEQVLYSRSILDFARIRLADSRAQLVVYQNTNMPPVEIQRRQSTVLELEQNVGLLEALIGGVAGILVNKLF